MSEVDAGVTDAAIARANDVTRRAVGTRWAAAGDDAGGPVRLGTTEMAQIKLDGRPAGAPVVAYLGPGAAPASGEAVAVLPLTDRAPQGWQIIPGAPVPVGSQSVLGVNGYVYGPYSVQYPLRVAGITGFYDTDFPTVRQTLGAVSVGTTRDEAWARITASVTASDRPEPPAHAPVTISCEYVVINAEWPPGSSPFFLAGGANAPEGGTAFDPAIELNDVAAGGWYRTDGAGTNTPNLPWMTGTATGQVQFNLFYTVNGHGTYSVEVYLHTSVRRGRSIGAGGGPVRATAFAGIPGYPP